MLHDVEEHLLYMCANTAAAIVPVALFITALQTLHSTTSL